MTVIRSRTRPRLGPRPPALLVAAAFVVVPFLAVGGAGATALMAPAHAAAAPAGGRGGSSYTVRPGDTLTGIAARTGVTVNALAAANRMADPDHLVAGTVLTLPSRSSSTSTSTSARGTTSYTIRSGDTWWGIARCYGIRPADLAAANGSSPDSTIFAGRTLVIPARRTTATAAAAAGSGARAGSAVSAASSTPAATSGQLPAKLTAHPERLALLPVFNRAAAEFGVPADLLKSVAYMESGWNPQVISYKGAMGIGQLMPATAAEVARWLGEPALDPWDATDNIRMSARYLRYLLDLNGGDSNGALAAYYQGHVSVLARGLDVDTQNYVRVIQGNRPLFS